MKKLRSFVALCLIAASLLSLSSGVFAYQNASDWATGELDEAQMLGILPDTMKDADMKADISREEMCEIAALAYEKLTGNTPYPNRTDYFSDTDAELVCAAYEIGIVDGFDDGTFQPEGMLTRQQFFMIVTNLYSSIGVPTHITQDYLAGFSDRDEVSYWATTAAQTVVGLGVVNGVGEQSTGKTYLQPKANTSRQQAIIMFLRAYKFIEGYLATDWLTEEDIKALEAAAAEEAASDEAQALVKYALTLVGKSYVFGATGPNSFDCSGFTQYVYKHFGYSINRIAQAQSQNGTAVEYKNLQPGDLILFANTYSSSERITHVGIYIGDGKIVHAANSTRGVTVDSITSGYYYSHYDGARRILK